MIPLARAALCLSCEGEPIFDLTDQVCPTCGGASFALLARWLEDHALGVGRPGAQRGETRLNGSAAGAVAPVAAPSLNEALTAFIARWLRPLPTASLRGQFLAEVADLIHRERQAERRRMITSPRYYDQVAASLMREIAEWKRAL